MSATMTINSIFNPTGDDSAANRRIWGGNPTNLIQLNDVRYGWATQLYQQMQDQRWIPQKIDITQDVTDYQNLTPDERRAFNGVLSYLTFLDSIQVCNIPHLKASITAPEVSLCMAEQISQEGMHSQSYQYMLESIVPADQRAAVFYHWRDDAFLFERCKSIASLYQAYIEDPTPENYFVSLLGNYMLEGVFFYCGFMFAYTLANRQLMAGSADIFKLINRDELSHLRLYQRILPEAMESLPHSQDQILELFDTAAQQEIAWSNHIADNVLGITPHSTESYVKWLANNRLRAIGLPNLYDADTYNRNPYSHLERFSDTKGDGGTKANFFEASVTSYVMSSGLTGWEDF